MRRPCQSHQTVKDVLEAIGIPHTEIDLILAAGEAVGFEHRPAAGDRIAVYPMFEALEIGSTGRLRPVPLRDPRFVVDVNLGRLARLLRMLDFDVWWSSDADDDTLAEISLGQQRILLTRDRGLLKRSAITHGLFVHSAQPEDQALEVIRRLDLRRRVAPLTRCVRCNGRLVAVATEEVMDRLQPLTRRYYDEIQLLCGVRAGLLARVAFREADWACGRTPRTGGRGGAVAAGRSDVSWRKRVPPERRGARFLNSACGSAYSAHRSGFEVIDKAAADE